MNKKCNAGRPQHVPTEDSRAKVQKMSGYGVPQQMIAGVFDICENTLKKHYSRELALGKGMACANIGQRIYQRAFEDGDVTALIWYSKTQMGWTDKTEVAQTITISEGETLAERLTGGSKR